MLGIKKLAALSYDLELMGKAGTLDGAAGKIEIAGAEYARVKDNLAHELQGEHV